jgi:indole-3-glycerol phosphate synthase
MPEAGGPGKVADILVRIERKRRERLRERAGDPTLPPASERSAGNALIEAVAAHAGHAVIAEVKMGSPRLGSLVGRIEPERQAKLYADHGAAAMSVVVEPDFFHGSYELLERCKRASGLPTLAKDFVVDPVQLRWAADAGADAVLLIAALLERSELLEHAEAARELGLVPLIETHDAEDLKLLEGASWELVGVNNRDLRTFEVSLEHSIALVPLLPPGALRVAESGIDGAGARRRLEEAGFDAFLVGEALLLAPDPAAKLQEILGRPR